MRGHVDVEPNRRVSVLRIGTGARSTPRSQTSRRGGAGVPPRGNLARGLGSTTRNRRATRLLWMVRSDFAGSALLFPVLALFLELRLAFRVSLGDPDPVPGRRADAVDVSGNVLAARVRAGARHRRRRDHRERERRQPAGLDGGLRDREARHVRGGDDGDCSPRCCSCRPGGAGQCAQETGATAVSACHPCPPGARRATVARVRRGLPVPCAAARSWRAPPWPRPVPSSVSRASSLAHHSSTSRIRSGSALPHGATTRTVDNARNSPYHSRILPSRRRRSVGTCTRRTTSYSVYPVPSAAARFSSIVRLIRNSACRSSLRKLSSSAKWRRSMPTVTACWSSGVGGLPGSFFLERSRLDTVSPSHLPDCEDAGSGDRATSRDDGPARRRSEGRATGPRLPRSRLSIQAARSSSQHLTCLLPTRTGLGSRPRRSPGTASTALA